MQAGLFFLDMPVKSAGLAQFQKVAVKMPGQISAKSTICDENFKAIMDTLMALSPEQLHASLGGLEWVPVDEGIDTLAPLIDLSAKEDVSEGIVALLKNSEKISMPYLLEPNGEQPQVERGILKSPTFNVENNENHQQNPLDKALEPQTPSVLATPKNHLNKMEAGLVEDRGELKTQTALANQKSLNALSARQEEALPNIAKETGKIVEIMPKETPHEMQKTTLHAKSISGTMEVLKDAPGADDADKIAAALKRTVEPHNRISNNTANSNAAPGQSSVTTTNIAAEQFGFVSNSVGNQRNKVGLKANMRNNAQSTSSQIDLEGAEVENHKIQTQNTPKEASLSFSSRWGAMLEKSAETIAETKSSAAVPERIESNDIVKQIVQRMTLKAGRLQSQMNIKLKPEFLGNVRMQITSDNHQVVVRMVAESVVVKEMIEQNLQFLKTELQQHGIEINKFDVFVGGESDDLKQGHESNLQQRSQPKGQGAREKGKERGYDAEKNETVEEQSGIEVSGNDKEIDYFA